MRVSEQFIASLLSRVDIVEVVGKKVSLRRTGANFTGLCPFHQEKTPSFSVNLDKQFFHCFGCKESGDAIKFVMQMEHKSFVDAVEMLANDYGLRMEKESPQEINPLADNIYKTLNTAADFYHQELLKNNTAANLAGDYLKNRKISLETIKHFNLGFISSGWNNLLNFFLHQDANIMPILLQAGLVLEKNGKFYDRFRERIIFPIRNRFGKTIGFGARALTAEQTPKYLNSPETIVFIKNRELYGLFEARQQLKNLNSLIIVEGYIDVITLSQAGIHNVVATLGTALSENHLKTIFSVTSEVIFCFDGDLAGEHAAVRAMELTISMMGWLKDRHVIKFASLPKNYDPDLLVREQGADQFKQVLLGSKGLSDFFFEVLSKKYPEKNIENLNKLAHEAKLQIAKLPDQLLQDLWYEKLSGVLGVDSNALKSSPKNKTKSANNIIKNTANYYYPPSNAYRALAMLLLDKNLLQFCEQLHNPKFDQLKLPQEIDLFIKVVKVLESEPEKLAGDLIDIEKLAAYLEPVYAQKLLSIDSKKIVQTIPQSGIEQEFVGAVKRINRVLLEQVIEELLIIAKQRNLENTEKLTLQQTLNEL